MGDSISPFLLRSATNCGGASFCIPLPEGALLRVLVGWGWFRTGAVGVSRVQSRQTPVNSSDWLTIAKISACYLRPLHSSGGKTVVTHGEEMRWMPGVFMWDSGQTSCNWCKFLSEFHRSPPFNHQSIIAPYPSITGPWWVIALIRQHIITSSGFKLTASSLTLNLAEVEDGGTRYTLVNVYQTTRRYNS
jgi:hypothetical protein